MNPKKWFFDQLGKINNFFMALVKTLKDERVKTNLTIDGFYFLLFFAASTFFLLASWVFTFKYRNIIDPIFVVLAYYQVLPGSIKDCQKLVHDILRENMRSSL